MKKSLLALIAIVGLARLDCAASATGEGSDGGDVAEADLERLGAYARSQREDLIGDLKQASGKDKVALARVFRFSLKFTELDANANTYGQIIYSSFLGEAYTTKQYARLVAAQPDTVRQRVRDFLYYEMIHDDPDTVREQEEKQSSDWLLLFPRNYSYGSQDLLFRKGAGGTPAARPP